jgi:hypothetical protein
LMRSSVRRFPFSLSGFFFTYLTSKQNLARDLSSEDDTLVWPFLSLYCFNASIRSSNVIIIFVVVDVVIVADVSTRILGTRVTVGASDAAGGYMPSDEESWTGDFVGSAGGAMLGYRPLLSNNDARCDATGEPSGELAWIR